VDAGNFTDSEILVMLGENGTGKTTFIRILAVSRHEGLRMFRLPTALIVDEAPV
jgi:translation initiation factor RLI1